jgi:hypothetical protein
MGGCGPKVEERRTRSGREPGATATSPDPSADSSVDEVGNVALADTAAEIASEMHEATTTDRVKPFLLLYITDGVHPRRWTRVIGPWPLGAVGRRCSPHPLLCSGVLLPDENKPPLRAWRDWEIRKENAGGPPEDT